WHTGNFDPNTKANASHTHSASDITSGTLSDARLPATIGGNKTFSNNVAVGGTLAVSGAATFAASTFSGTVTLSGAAGARVFDIVSTSASQIWAMRTQSDRLQIGARTSTGSWSNPPAFTITRSGDTITQVEVPVALTVGGTISGNGPGLTSLNASNLSSGTVPSDRLPSTIGGNKTFSNNVTVGGTISGNGSGLTSLDGKSVV